MELRHEKIAKIALKAASRHGLALAGGYAIRAHGMGSRPSGDVDLFTDWQQRTSFPEVVAAVTRALRGNGFTVEINTHGETFARLTVTEEGSDSIPDKVELAADWRAHPPINMEIGPVLHPDDAVANKMCALFGRALARDFLDIDAAITSGRYTWAQLLNLAKNADAGFDPAIFEQALGALNQLVVGRNTWRVVYRLSEAGTIEVCEIWAIGARADAAVYAEAAARVRNAAKDKPEFARLADVVDRLGRLADGIVVEQPSAPDPVPDWLAERLVHTVGLDREVVATMDLQQAVDQGTAYMAQPRQ